MFSRARPFGFAVPFFSALARSMFLLRWLPRRRRSSLPRLPRPTFAARHLFRVDLGRNFVGLEGEERVAGGDLSPDFCARQKDSLEMDSPTLGLSLDAHEGVIIADKGSE